ncbi:MAG: hypothetical protein JWN44_1230 [Myxococcales bacterium]|nr:hypothetical protein [Myxococcales bacterium]
MSRIAHVIGLLLLAAGCSGSSSGATMNEPEATALPPIKVDLPSPPSFAASDVPEKNPDGTFTVRGLRKKKAENLNKEIKVKAYLLEVYICPKCPKGQTCKMCDQPHFFMGDKPDTKKEKALMVVDYLGPKQKPPALTVGKQYDVAGTYSINSPTGFGASDGLVVFDSMTDDKGVVFQSPAKALEEKALKGEAQEQALEAKRNAAMKKKK